MRAVHRRLVITAAAAAALSLAACGAAGGKTSGAIGDEMVMGNPNAKVTVIEYASASCSHCAKWHAEVYPTFKKKYVDTGQVKFVFREFLTAPPQVAAAGFLLARCAGKDRYFPVLEQVFRSQNEWGRTGDVRTPFLRIAQSVGMNEQQFTACVSNEKELTALNNRVERFAREGQIESTPTFVVNGKKVSGELSLAQLDAMIAEANKK